jgi:hypothetical protein
MSVTEEPTMVIDTEEIRRAGRLISLEDAYNILSTTEPLHQNEFALDGSNDVAFSLPLGWNDEIRDKDATTLTDCTVQIDGAEPVRLTKEAILKMTSSIGLTKDYVMRTPGLLIAPQLNWWLKHYGVKGAESMRLLAKDGVAVGIVKSTLSTFPNVPLLDRVVQQIKERYQTDEILVDYKIAHTLERTALRLIVPETSVMIDSARNDSTREDRWSLGLQLTNSLVGDPETRLNLSGYLFAWWCTNGAISTHASSGNYNRRVQGQDLDEVLGWIDASVDAIFTDLEPELDDVAALTTEGLEGELNDVIADVFKTLKVPVPARQGVLDALVDSDDLTAYGLMQAVTQAANDPDISDRVREGTMRVGGMIPHTIKDRCENCHRVLL